MATPEYTSGSRSAAAYKRTDSARFLDNGFVWLTGAFAYGVMAVLLGIALQVASQAIPAFGKFGLGFLGNSVWDPVKEAYGVWPQIFGTLLTSLIALLIAVPIGLGIALFLSEDFLPDKVKRPLVFMIELLAAIPSVVYGLWGIFVLIPFLLPISKWLHTNFGWIPFFSTPPTGPGVHVAGIILAIMILPIIAAISRDALTAVPGELRQASYGLGSTRWEAIFKVIIPAAFSGIVGGIMLALGRAMGETMAVTMVIGNANKASPSIFSQGSTISSLLANQFAEASGLQSSSLMYGALALFFLTLVVNVLAEYIIRRFSIKY
jgi:phosphate transport system permease protein